MESIKPLHHIHHVCVLVFWCAESLHGVLVRICAVFGVAGVVCMLLCRIITWCFGDFLVQYLCSIWFVWCGVVLCFFVCFVFGGFLVCICAVFGVLVYSCAVFGGFLVHFFAVFSVFGVLVHSCAVFGVILCVWCFGVVIVIFVLYLVCLVWCVLASVAQSSPAVTLSL